MNDPTSQPLPVRKCIECDGQYIDCVEDYKIEEEIIPNLLLRKCSKCGHTILPWQSVEVVDKILTRGK